MSDAPSTEQNFFDGDWRCLGCAFGCARVRGWAFRLRHDTQKNNGATAVLPDLQVVVTDDYLRPELEQINRTALEAGRPWMLVKPVGQCGVARPDLRAGRDRLLAVPCSTPPRQRRGEGFNRPAAKFPGGFYCLSTNVAAGFPGNSRIRSELGGDGDREMDRSAVARDP